MHRTLSLVNNNNADDRIGGGGETHSYVNPYRSRKVYRHADELRGISLDYFIGRVRHFNRRFGLSANFILPSIHGVGTVVAKTETSRIRDRLSSGRITIDIRRAPRNPTTRIFSRFPYTFPPSPPVPTRSAANSRTINRRSSFDERFSFGYCVYYNVASASRSCAYLPARRRCCRCLRGGYTALPVTG